MAWTNLVNALFLPGKKILGSTGMALRDNSVAIANGDALAPRIQLPALARIPVGDTIKFRSDGVQATSSGSFISAGFSHGYLQSGTIRVTFDHRRTSGGSEVRIQRRRAGSTTNVATFSTSSGSFVGVSEDVAVQSGDVIFLEFRATGGGGAEIQNRRIRTAADFFLWPGNNFGEIENNPTVT
jgi:hypothetical protein